jgi:hypothetical protein
MSEDTTAPTGSPTNDTQRSKPGRGDPAIEFARVCLAGPAEFLKPIVQRYSNPSDLQTFSEANCRDFVLLNVLVEVQRAGMALIRHAKSCTYERVVANDDQPDVVSNEVESLTDELSLWQRKLSEGLVLLVNFCSTNDLLHYYYFLLISSREEFKRRLTDQRIYFEKVNSGDSQSLKLIESKIAMIRGQITDPTLACWYLEEPTKTLSRIASFSKQLQIALPQCTVEERRALAFTYAKGFGDASGCIHFSNLRPSDEKPQQKIPAVIGFIGLLSCEILRRAHSISGLIPSGINRSVVRTGGNLAAIDPVSRRGVIGDFVITDGPQVGVIEEIHTSVFGYESYRVKFLKLRNTARSQVADDWFTAFDILPFLSQQDLKSGINEVLKQHGMTAFNPPSSDEEIKEVTQLAVLEMLAHGLDDYLQQTLKPLAQERIDPSIQDLRP